MKNKLKEFAEELKKKISKLTIYTKTNESPILVRRAYVLDKINNLYKKYSGEENVHN